MGRAANQNVNDSSEFTVTGSHLIDLDRPAAGVASALRTETQEECKDAQHKARDLLRGK
jgi:hypothetical protein